MDKENKLKNNLFIGFRVSKIVKQKVEKYAKEHKFTVGDLMIISVLIHIGEHDLAGKMLIRKETKKETEK